MVGILWQIVEQQAWCKRHFITLPYNPTIPEKISSWCKLFVMAILPLYNLLVILTTFWFVFSDEQKERQIGMMVDNGKLVKRE
jgi:hypothetical protein